MSWFSVFCFLVVVFFVCVLSFFCRTKGWYGTREEGTVLKYVLEKIRTIPLKFSNLK